MKKAIAAMAVVANLFGSVKEAEEHICECGQLYYCNEFGGYRSYRLKGEAGCQKCRGTGAIETCEKCGGCGMLPGSKLCVDCRGTGKIPFTVGTDLRRHA